MTLGTCESLAHDFSRSTPHEPNPACRFWRPLIELPTPMEPPFLRLESGRLDVGVWYCLPPEVASDQAPAGTAPGP